MKTGSRTAKAKIWLVVGLMTMLCLACSRDLPTEQPQPLVEELDDEVDRVLNGPSEDLDNKPVGVALPRARWNLGVGFQGSSNQQSEPRLMTVSEYCSREGYAYHYLICETCKILPFSKECLEPANFAAAHALQARLDAQRQKQAELDRELAAREAAQQEEEQRARIAAREENDREAQEATRRARIDRLPLIAGGLHGLAALLASLYVWRRLVRGSWPNQQTRLVFQKLHWTRFYVVSVLVAVAAAFLAGMHLGEPSAGGEGWIGWRWLIGAGAGLLLAACAQYLTAHLHLFLPTGGKGRVGPRGKEPFPASKNNPPADAGLSDDW